MSDTKEQSEVVCKELRQLRAHSIGIKEEAVCDICDLILLVKPFFVFICGHKFHSDCLEKQVIPILSKELSRRLTMLKQEMETLMAQTIALANQTPEQQKSDPILRQKLRKFSLPIAFTAVSSLRLLISLLSMIGSKSMSSGNSII